MDRNKAQALLAVMKNLDDICNTIAKEILTTAQMNYDTDLPVDKLITNIRANSYYKNTPSEDEDEIIVPELKFDIATMSMTVNVKVNDNDYLTVSNSTADFNTQQMSIGYVHGDSNTMIDIALAEIKKGELAEVHNLASDNKDIDLYVYDDPYNEDFTIHKQIEYSEIESACKSN